MEVFFHCRHLLICFFFGKLVSPGELKKKKNTDINKRQTAVVFISLAVELRPFALMEDGFYSKVKLACAQQSCHRLR